MREPERTAGTHRRIARINGNRPKVERVLVEVVHADVRENGREDLRREHVGDRIGRAPCSVGFGRVYRTVQVAELGGTLHPAVPATSLLRSATLNPICLPGTRSFSQSRSGTCRSLKAALSPRPTPRAVGRASRRRGSSTWGMRSKKEEEEQQRSEHTHRLSNAFDHFAPRRRNLRAAPTSTPGQARCGAVLGTSGKQSRPTTLCRARWHPPRDPRRSASPTASSLRGLSGVKKRRAHPSVVPQWCLSGARSPPLYPVCDITHRLGLPHHPRRSPLVPFQ